MDINKPVETRGGCKVRIYARDGGTKYPIHGATMGNDGSWEAISWTKDGRLYPHRESEADLVNVQALKLPRLPDIGEDIDFGTCVGRVVGVSTNYPSGRGNPAIVEITMHCWHNEDK